MADNHPEDTFRHRRTNRNDLSHVGDRELVPVRQPLCLIHRALVSRDRDLGVGRAGEHRRDRRHDPPQPGDLPAQPLGRRIGRRTDPLPGRSSHLKILLQPR